MLRLAPLTLLLLVACDGCDDNTASQELTAQETTEGAAEAEVETEAAESESVRHERPPAPSEEELLQIAEARRLLGVGRRAGQAGEWASAIETLRASLEASESANARCELGWALYHDERSDEAVVELSRGVLLLRPRAAHNERHRNTLGACLYNLGRIVQANDPAAAAAYYRESVHVRPNDAVSAQLAQLAQAESEPAECQPTRCAGPLPSEDDEEDGPYETAIQAAVAELSGADPRTSSAQGWHGDVDVVGTHANVAYVVVPSSDARFVCPLDIRGDFGENSVGSLANAQWIEGGESEVTVDFDTSASGHEEGISNTMGMITRHFYGLENGAMWSFGRVKVSEYYEDGMWDDCHCEDERSEDGDRPSPWDCCESIRDLGGAVRWDIRSAGDGLLRVTRQTEDAPPEDADEGPAVEVVALRELCARTITQ